MISARVLIILHNPALKPGVPPTVRDAADRHPKRRREQLPPSGMAIVAALLTRFVLTVL
jgi:hypothetical protein